MLCLFFSHSAQLQFQQFRFKKGSGPAAIREGGQSVYTVLMDGPPESEVTLDLQTAVDGYIRCRVRLDLGEGLDINQFFYFYYSEH